MTTLLLVGLEPTWATQVANELTAAGLRIEQNAERRDYDCVLCSPEAYFACFNPISQFHHKPVLLLTEHGDFVQAVRAIKRGAADYLVQPVSSPQLQMAVNNAVGAPVVEQSQLGGMIGKCAAMRALMDQVKRIAISDASVLICGDSGTGKKVVAKAIHLSSDRASQPFLSLNCAAIPDRLLEAELFGPAESTDTTGEQRPGLLNAAEGGTLFVDEIGELPQDIQARLLQVLNSDQFRPPGSVGGKQMDVRIIAASQRNLLPMIQDGRFREDLFYRLTVFSLTVPPLRQRGEDILLLAQACLERVSDKLNKEGLKFSTRAKSALQHYPWPGNVRELENAVERAVILCEAGIIETRHLAIELAPEALPQNRADHPEDQTSLEDYFVQFVLQHQDQFTETELAEKLGISRKSLWERRQRLNIPRRKTRKRGLRRSTS